MKSRYDAVYIPYPRGSQTGGPEALHQLGAALMELGIPVFLVPLPKTKSNPRVVAYKAYNLPEALRIPDRKGIAVVVPESR